MKALDIDAVQAFVLVAELNSFTRAAEAMATTQSAVSLKIKWLEARLERMLFERTPRLVRLSMAGKAFLEPARSLLAAHETAISSFASERQRLVVGMSGHIVGSDLPLWIANIKRTAPLLVVELRVSLSREILDAFDHGELDAAIVLRHDHARLDGDMVLSERFGWMAAPQFASDPSAPIPLAMQIAPCSIRDMAVAALDRAGIAWSESFVGNGVATLGSVIAAGLAVAPMAQRVAPPGTIDVGPRLGLPELGSLDIVVHSKIADPVARAALRTLIAAMRATAA